MPGPPNKWVASKVSVTSDPNAQTSAQVLVTLNNFPFNGTATVACSDGTFLFVGWYA